MTLIRSSGLVHNRSTVKDMQPSNLAVYRFMDCTLQVVANYICDCTVISHQALSQWRTCLYWLEWNLFDQALSAFIGRGFLKNYKMSGMDSPSTPSWLEGRRFLAQVEGRCRSRAAMSGWRAASSLHAPVPSSSSNGKPRWRQTQNTSYTHWYNCKYSVIYYGHACGMPLAP